MDPGLSVKIPVGDVTLDGTLLLPADPKGIIIFAHGAGSNQRSHRNLLAAEALWDGGVGSLLFDLLTPEEQERYRQEVFDIGKLSARLVAVTRWLMGSPEVTRSGVIPAQAGTQKPIGYLGASTGAAAALNAAAELGARIAVVVSRGGRPDLAEQDRLSQVTAPTLFIIGSEDKEVLEASKPPFELLTCEKRLDLVPGATHVFEEPGTLEEATRLAKEWILGRLK